MRVDVIAFNKTKLSHVKLQCLL